MLLHRGLRKAATLERRAPSRKPRGREFAGCGWFGRVGAGMLAMGVRATRASGVAGESNRGRSPLLRPCFPGTIGADSVRDSCG
ncbi:hypothetical protein PCLA_01r0233 [Pseudomonas citronellolis]|nr:hypothetical protein PCLA_01r0233 [Pseudomonas citronellolis]